MIRVIRVCRKCGAKIFSDAPRGLCTACMLETALGIFPDAVAGADSSAGSLDELPRENAKPVSGVKEAVRAATMLGELGEDRKSTRLNSSHVAISYAVFCLKKKKPRPAWSCRL